MSKGAKKISRFAKEIKNKIKIENNEINNSLTEVASSINLNKFTRAKQNSDQTSKQAIYEILAFFNIEPAPVPKQIKKLKHEIVFLLNAHNIITRKIKLDCNWFKCGLGAILATNKVNNTLVALTPSKTCGYFYTDFITKKKIKINKKNSRMFSETATLCYEPLPETEINFKTLAHHLKKEVSIVDLLSLVGVSLILTFLGLITPKMVKLIFSVVVELKNIKILNLIGLFLLTTTISEHFFKIIKIIIIQKIINRIITKLEAAMVFRVFSLPISFFKSLNSGEIFERINTLKAFCQNAINCVLQTWLSCALSLFYFFQIFSYSPVLIIPTVASAAAFSIFGAIAAMHRSKIGFKQMDFKSTETATTIELISGIEKIKLAGAEKSAFALWANQFAKALKIKYNPPTTLKLNKIVLSAIKIFTTISTYAFAAIYDVDPASFFAFSLAFEVVNKVFLNMATTAIELAKIKPIYKFLEPIFKTKPEPTKNKNVVTSIKGAVTVSGLCFSYNNNIIIKNFSFKIEPKQSIAILGECGSGKTTLVRLLIGLEQPTSGTIFFDSSSLDSLNLKTLRQKIGVVFDEDKISNGNIFLNIAAKNKNLSLKQAWRAAKIAQIDQDIAKMPMKMNTLIAQEGNEFSASQVQRILIARAIASQPKILILDNATSELSIKTQAEIFKQLKQLNCSIIVTTNRPEVAEFCGKIVRLNKPTL